jgi:hypothetical protein
VTSRRQGAHEEHAAHGLASAADEALALPLARLSRPGGEAGEGCDLTAIEGSEFGHLGDQGAGDDRPDARNGGEQVFLLDPHRRPAPMVVGLGVEFGGLLLERLAQPGDALLQTRRSAPLALTLGSHHFDDLAPASDQIDQKPVIS